VPERPCSACRASDDGPCVRHRCSACEGTTLVYGGLDNPGGSALKPCSRCKATGLEPEAAR
jgi:hypothetical protein